MCKVLLNPDQKLKAASVTENKPKSKQKNIDFFSIIKQS